MMGPRKGGDAMARGERRQCKCCLKLFRPDPRNRRHQRYCSAPACKAASKAASQARWLTAPENQTYFCGPIHVARVRAWRSRHPGYCVGGKRYKVSQLHKALILRWKRAISRTLRYKSS
jgi:hypothetical protein